MEKLSVYIIRWMVSASMLLCLTEGHGRLLEPPGRSTMWRFGLDTPINYNDNQLFCGGFSKQHYGNGGKCGICGDDFSDDVPRDNEAGGKYGRGVIARNYRMGSEITAQIQLTANHQGWFEFRLCPNNDVHKIATQECLDQYILELADGSGTRYQIPNGFGYAGTFELKLTLPRNLTCTQCVFQWHYNTASNWGICEDGTGKMGCGIQEVFRGCADVAISE